MASAGVPLRTLKEMMGHRDIATTMRYADYAPSQHEVAMVDAAFARPNPDILSDGNRDRDASTPGPVAQEE